MTRLERFKCNFLLQIFILLFIVLSCEFSFVRIISYESFDINWNTVVNCKALDNKNSWRKMNVYIIA